MWLRRTVWGVWGGLCVFLHEGVHVSAKCVVYLCPQKVCVYAGVCVEQ